jgi:hypothetical protein
MDSQSSFTEMKLSSVSSVSDTVPVSVSECSVSQKGQCSANELYTSVQSGHVTNEMVNDMGAYLFYSIRINARAWLY